MIQRAKLACDICWDGATDASIGTAAHSVELARRVLGAASKGIFVSLGTTSIVLRRKHRVAAARDTRSQRGTDHGVVIVTGAERSRRKSGAAPG